MSPCDTCSQRVRCPVAVPYSLLACRLVKWAAATMFLIAYASVWWSSKKLDALGVDYEMQAMFAFRISMITVAFSTCMWACNHVIIYVKAGGLPAYRIIPPGEHQ